MGNKCAIYLRVSTELQDYEHQKNDLMKYANAYNYSLDDSYIFSDKVSGFKKEQERPGFAALMEKVRNEEIDIVLTWEISRLSREQIKLLELAQEFEKHRVNIYFYYNSLWLLDRKTLKIDSNSGLVISVLAYMAEDEAQRITGRMAAGKIRYVKEGKYNGGKITFGYTITQFGKTDDSSKKKFIPNTKKIDGLNVSEVDIVREVFDLYESGLTCPKIAHKSKAKGYPTKVKSQHTLARMLRDTSYIGYKDVKLGRRPLPQIIEEAQFQRVGELLDENKTKADKGRKHTYLLRKILKCKVCGKYYQGKQTDDAYQCSQNNQTNKIIYGTSCAGSNISVSNIDGIVWERIKDVWINKSLGGFGDLFKPDDSEIEDLRKEIEQYKSLFPSYDVKRRKINTKFDNDGITEDEYTVNIKELLKQINDTKDTITTLESRIRRMEKVKKQADSVIGRKKDIDSITDRDEMKELIEAFVRQITFEKITIFKTLVYITYHNGKTDIILFNSVAKKEIVFKLINEKCIEYQESSNSFLLFKEQYHKVFQSKDLSEFARNKLETDLFLPPLPQNSDIFSFDELMDIDDIPDIVTTHPYQKITYFQDLNKKRFQRRKR